jgi:hypothetical protein
MYVIHTEFIGFRDVRLTELIGATGVYVIWDARAKARPTYIGEGNILKRFTDHVTRDGRRFAHPWNGYVAIIAGSTRDVHKEESRAVERLLLDVADETDRMPIVNVHPGSAAAVLSFCEKETLRVTVSGYDPLAPPGEARALRSPKQIRAWAHDHDTYCVEHDWRLRRVRAPIT